MIFLPIFISGGEIAFIVFILVMVFGADKIPEIARGLGKGMRQVKDATEDIKREITKSTDIVENNVVSKEIKGHIKKVSKDIEDIKGPISRRRF